MGSFLNEFGILSSQVVLKACQEMALGCISYCL